MKINQSYRAAAALSALAALALSLTSLKAQVPTDFPSFTVTTYDTNAVGNGYIFLSVTDTSTNVGYYVMVLRNDGTPVYYQSVPNHSYDFKLLPNGFLHNAPFYHTHSWTGGGDVNHQIFDGNGTLRETVGATNGYTADGHDFQLLPNGNVLLISYYKSQMDLSRIVPGAYPNALVAGAVLQELDAQRNAIWQWRSWDYYNFQTYYGPVLGTMLIARNPVVDSFHINTVVLDKDGNLLISNFMMDVQKINRQTGQVMWRLGGLGNQFSFVGVNPQAALTHFSCHTLTRLDNGNILLYCNADQQATRSSKIYEYRLDEVNKVATLVWSYTPTNPCYAWHYGSAQRLPNGNTFIGWGGANIMPGIGGVTNAQVPACTEVTSAGRVVFEMKFNDPLVYSYRAFRFPYPPQSQDQTAQQLELVAGNSYDFASTGVSLDVTTGGGGYNSLIVTREPYAPVYPLFNGKPPVVLPQRVKLTETALDSLGATLYFDVAALNLNNPANLTVYYRQNADQGLFIPQTTDYNPVTGKLSVSVDLAAQGNDLGEFIFGSPDVAEVPYPPILNAAENYRGIQPYEVVAPLAAVTGTVYVVNQQLPVSLSWSPRGFARYYQLQISATQDFATPLVDEPYLTDAFYVWSAPTNGLYYYQVKTWNDGGEGTWSAGTFQATSPFVQVTIPNGGEAWRRGLSYFIQWNDNLAENVSLDLYKDGAFVRNIVGSTPSTGAYKWPIPASLTPGSDYSVRITSTTNNTMVADSASTFSVVDPPVLSTVTQLGDGRLQFAITAPGAATARVLVSTNLTTWQVLQRVSLVNGSGVFTDTAPATLGKSFYRVTLP